MSNGFLSRVNLLATHGGYRLLIKKAGDGISSFCQRSNGTSSVEFVLVLPVLALFLFGIIQFGSVLYLQSNMANAAREAARSMSVGESNIATQSPPEAGSAEYLALNWLANWNLPFTVVATEPNPDQVTVQVSVPASQAAFGDMFGIWGSSTLTTTVTMRKEG